MAMKKIICALIVFCLYFAALPSQLKAESALAPKTMNAGEMEEKADANVLLTRLEVLHKMDKSKLTSAERSNIRKEVITIREKLKTLGGGIYLSVGAIIIIIIILLLILLL